MTQSLDPIFQMPGKVTAMLGAIWSGFDQGKPFSYNSHLLKEKGGFDTACLLSIYNAIELPDQWADTLEESEKELLRFCTFSTPSYRALNDHMYVDEIRTLQLNKSSEEMQALLTSRFNDYENVGMEALETEYA
jgi:hypothetical protein